MTMQTQREINIFSCEKDLSIKCKLQLNVQLHSPLFCKFSWVKSSHFNRNPHDWEFGLRVKHVQCRFASGSSWSRRFALVTIRKLLSLKVFCVSGASYISTLLTMEFLVCRNLIVHLVHTNSFSVSLLV